MKISRKFFNPRVLGGFFFVLVFFPFPRLGEELLFEPITNSVHLGLGALLFFLIARLNSQPQESAKFAVPSLLISLVAAWLIEEIQPFFGRSSSSEDLILSFFGSLVAYLISIKNHNNNYFLPLLVSVLMGLIFALAPIVDGVKLYFSKWESYPLLVFPGFKLNALVNEIGKAKLLREVGDCSFVFNVSGAFDGIEIPLDSEDWSSYSSLVIEIDNLSSAGKIMGIRIDDRGTIVEYDDRFNKRVSLEKGRAEINIPLDEIRLGVKREDFSLEEIKRILIFLPEGESDGCFCLRRVWLK